MLKWCNIDVTPPACTLLLLLLPLLLLLLLQAKFTQINEFLKLLIHTGQLEHMGQQQQQQPGSSSIAVHVLDCGCGSSHLTFGTLHYLHHVRGLPVQLTGIDTNAALMQRSNCYCADLGISDMAQFHTAAIRSYEPDTAPDIVLALHACDTATDEALALGVRLGTGVIMSVPCCQKDLHKQQAAAQQQQPRQRQRRQGSSSASEAGSSSSSSSADGELFDPLLSHGILRQRMLDLLTDGFRAQLLQLAGYRWVYCRSRASCSMMFAVVKLASVSYAAAAAGWIQVSISHACKESRAVSSTCMCCWTAVSCFLRTWGLCKTLASAATLTGRLAKPATVDRHKSKPHSQPCICNCSLACRTDVVEFVSTEHTPRNLLIRAVRQQWALPEAEQARLAGQYAALKQYWGVTPHLEKLMREDGTLPAALQ
jgi:hypothetical protein